MYNRAFWFLSVSYSLSLQTAVGIFGTAEYTKWQWSDMVHILTVTCAPATKGFHFST